MFGITNKQKKKIGPGPGVVLGSSVMVLGSDLGSNAISSRIPVSSMEIDEQSRLEVFDEQSRRSEASVFPSRVSGCTKVFDGQSLRLEESGSSSTVTGSLSVSSSSFAYSDDPAGVCR
jgi:hypothetical protein